MEKFENADAVILLNGNRYALFKSGPLSRYPHMVSIHTGQIVLGEQRPLLKEYLIQHGVDIEPLEKRNTHWCIRQAIKFANHE